MTVCGELVVDTAMRRSPAAPSSVSYPRLPRAGREHVDVHQGSETGVARFSHNHFDDRDPAAAGHRFAASLQDRDGPLGVPVVQDELQGIEIGGRHRLEEVAANDRAAFGDGRRWPSKKERLIDLVGQFAS